MQKKPRKPRTPAYPESPLGDLKQCPPLYLSYICVRCKRFGFFGSPMPCTCSKQNKFKNLRVQLYHKSQLQEFDSIGEAERFSRLAFLEAKQIISDLSRQNRFQLIVNDVVICDYYDDFAYCYQGIMYSEDYKGTITREFRLKFKLMLALFPKVHLVLTKRSKPTKFRRAYFSKGKAK